MKLYPFAPDPQDVNRHFVRMAKGVLKGRHSSQVGFGFAGSRLRFDGATTLESGRRSPDPVVKQVTPTQVGIQQARSELMANELKKKASGKSIKRLMGSVSKQKSNGKSGRKISGKVEKKSKDKEKKSTSVGKKKRKNKKSRRSDNFS